MKPNTRRLQEFCDPCPKPDFYCCYCFIVGSPNTLSLWPDLIWLLVWSYSEHSKYVQFPGIAHMEDAEHVLQYLSDTWNESIPCTRGSRNPNEFWGWVDADWADDTFTRRSHTGYILIMNGGPISWKCRRQDNVSLSRIRRRQPSRSKGYLRETLKDFSDQQQNSTEIYEDNLACVAMSKN